MPIHPSPPGPAVVLALALVAGITSQILARHLRVPGIVVLLATCTQLLRTCSCPRIPQCRHRICNACRFRAWRQREQAKTASPTNAEDKNPSGTDDTDAARK